jgi:glycosyltransferase involved in cell wall biosynthesis
MAVTRLKNWVPILNGKCKHYKTGIRLKVLHIINSLTIGGAEILLVNSLTTGGLQSHVENTLVYLQGTSYLEERIDRDVKIYCLNYKGLANLPQTLWRLRKIIKENKIDVIHSHLTPSSFYTNLARPKHVPQVHTVHIAYSTDFETRKALRFLERILFLKKRYCNLILLSEFTKADFLNAVKFKGRPFVLNNFIEDTFFDHSPKTFNGSETNALKLVAIGSFREQKNYFYLLEIFRHLKEYNIHLDIYGGGDTTDYRRVIEENNLNVTLKGEIKKVNEIIYGYDLFIMSSTNEGFPLSVFEAMAAGVPVMLTNIAPLTDIVKDNALYFELNEAEKAAAQIIAISKNKIDINGMAVKAKAYSEKTVRREIYIKKLLEIYKQLL